MGSELGSMPRFDDSDPKSPSHEVVANPAEPLSKGSPVQIRRKIEGLFERLRQPLVSATSAITFINEHRQFGRYELLRPLAEGSMGMVILADDSNLGRRVALKFPKGINECASTAQRFIREAKTAAQISHANICQIFDAGEIDGQSYIAMAYVDGEPLSSVLFRSLASSSGAIERGLSGDKATAGIIIKLANAFQTAHEAGIVHRDIKPCNIIVDKHGEPIVTDFGLAKPFANDHSARITDAGSIVGSIAYMSPEQVSGTDGGVGPQSDVYSLGVVLYEMLTGRLPFEGPVGSIIAKIQTEQPVRPSEIRPGINRHLEDVCLRMMARDRLDRYSSMKDVVSALTALPDNTVPADIGTEPSNRGAFDFAGPNDCSLNANSETMPANTSDHFRLAQNTLPTASASPLLSILRWISCLPAALAAAVIAHVVVAYGNRLSLELTWMNPDSVFGKLTIYLMSNSCAGGAAVAVATQVAPSNQSSVAVIAAAIILFGSGAFFPFVVAARDYWSIFGLFCMNCASIIVAIEIRRSARSKGNV